MGAVAPSRPAAFWPQELAATLDRLQRLAPRPTQRARDALGRLLAPLSDSVWPEIAWSFSRLTNTGMPVEFAWSSRDPALRYTAEVDAPEVADERRIAIAARRLRDLGCPVSAALNPWMSAQTRGPLKFGAWIGGRHGDRHDVYKLYIELPGVLPEIPALSHPHPLCRHAGMNWRMAGIDAAGDGMELYAHISDLDESLLDAIEATVFAGSGHLRKEIARLSGHDGLPNPSGLSLALDREGSILGVCWFVFAKVLFRDDEATRSAILRWTRNADVDPSLYQALTDGPRDGRWRHGIIGVGLDARGRSWLQAGLRPS